MITKKKLIKTIMICKEEIESCGDNYGSESCDKGYFDEILMDKALQRINSQKLSSTENKE